MRDSYHHNSKDTPGQTVFGRNMIFKLAPIVDLRVTNTRKHQKFDIDHACEKSSQFRNGYSEDNIV